MTVILVIFWLFVGLFVSEYVQLISDRESFRQSLFGRSKCDHCHKELPYWVLLPFLGQALTKSTCVYCKEKISTRYLWFEFLFFAGWAVSVYLLFIYTPFTSAILIAALCAFSLTALLMYEDYKHYSIPVWWLAVSLLVDVAFWYILGGTVLHFVDIAILLAMIMFSLLFVRIAKRNVIHSFSGMFGLADVIVLLVFVMLIGYAAITYVLVITAVIAILYLVVQKKLKPGQRLPFLTLLLPWALWAMIVIR